MFNISDFKAALERDGIIKTNHGQLFFTAPRGLQSTVDERDILVRCEQLSIPSIWFSSADYIQRYGYGPVDKAPHQPIFDPYNAVFIADRNGKVHTFFTDWMNLISNYDSSGGMSSQDNRGALPYEMSYRGDYIVDMRVKVYDETSQMILEYVLNNAWPQVLQEQPLFWAEQDNIVRLAVSFQYRDWRLVNRTPYNP